MTSPYTAAPPTKPAVWRVVLVVLACLLGPPAAAVAAFLAAVTWSGCFLACDPDGGDHAGGTAWGLLALALLALGPALAWLLLHSRRALVAAVGAVAAMVLTGAVLLAAN